VKCNVYQYLESAACSRPAARLFPVLVIALVYAILTNSPALAVDNSQGPMQFGVLAYFDYSNGKLPLADGGQADFSRFLLTRGYVTFKMGLTTWMSVRVTMDLHQDESGDYKRRDKYFYAELSPKDWSIFTDLKSEIGLGHMPWLDFEEHINPYRCQGTMAVERAGVFNSADAGVSLRGYFGGKLTDAQTRTGSSYYTGKYGSWHVGVFNGGGYHASEENSNAVVEGRFTLRPVPDLVPGLQLSYLGIYGKGNTNNDSVFQGNIPDYRIGLFYLSWQHPALMITAQYFASEGNAKGTWINPATGDALMTAGYSGFANWKIPGTNGRWNLFGRYDRFDVDKDNVLADQTAYDMYMGGVVFDFFHGNQIMLAYEKTTYEKDFGSKKGDLPEVDRNNGDEEKIQVVYQIKI